MVALRADHYGELDLHGRPAGLLAALRSLSRLPRQQALGLLGYAFKRPFFGFPLYPLTLAGGGPTALAVSPSDPWPGNAAAGEALVDGLFSFAGQQVRDPAPPWNPLGVSRGWRRGLHGFAWLRDLRAVGGDRARRRARELVADWLARHERWEPVAWDPVVTGQRLAHWLGQHDFFAVSAEVEFRHRLLNQIARQARHLARVLPAGLGGSDAITALKGLIYAGICLPDGGPLRAQGLEMLRVELGRQLLSDGGHAERSPARQLETLRDLIDLRALLHAGRLEVPDYLQVSIEQMAPLLRLLQHGDGGLCLFNDSNEHDGWQVDLVLQRAGGRSRPLQSGPESGFQRLQAGRAVVLVDAGPPPPPGFDRHAHAGTLSFEMSVGRERLIVNSGAYPGASEWRRVQRATAAHSTLVARDTNSSDVLRDGAVGRRPRNVSCRRDEQDGNIWLDLSHDGYSAPFGLIHRRRLFLAASGDDLRGEDSLEGPGGGHFAVRFHLHPGVRAGEALGGDQVFLRLDKGGGWRLKAEGAAIDLDDSIYMGVAGDLRRSRQIVLSGEILDGVTTVKWALQREAKPRAKRG